MQKRILARPGLWVFVLALLALGAMAGVQVSRIRPATAPQESSGLRSYTSPQTMPTQAPAGYPAPAAPMSPSDVMATSAARVAEATAHVSAPQATIGAVAGPQTISDTVNHVSMALVAGWYAYVAHGAYRGVTEVANFDFVHPGHRPLHGVDITISSDELMGGQSFEQWLADARIKETSPDFGGFGVALTIPQPYKLGNYSGIAYVATGPDGRSNFIIAIPSTNGWITIIGLTPYRPSNWPAIVPPEALQTLMSIRIAPPLR